MVGPVNGGRNNVVENNFLIDRTSCGLRVIDGCAYYPAAQEMRNFTRGNRFRGNIVFSASEAPLLLVLGVRADEPITDSDQNLYCGDYSLLPDSPAHALGIVGIDQGRIGPRSGRGKVGWANSEAAGGGFGAP